MSPLNISGTRIEGLNVWKRYNRLLKSGLVDTDGWTNADVALKARTHSFRKAYNSIGQIANPCP